MAQRTVDADIAVVGAGMAGLSGAVRAGRMGADVLLLEKGARAGGSMRLSAGLVWTYDSVEAARENVPRGDPALQRLVVERLDDRFDWLESFGVTVREPPVELPTGDVVTAPTPGANCGKVDPDDLTERMLAHVRDAGGRVRLETPMTDLRVDDQGHVVGLAAEGPDGSVRVDADAVLLATGGFQGSEELLQRHVTPRVENIWLRANPWSTGDGLRAAREVGATTTRGMDTFYGHNLAAPPAAVTPDRFLDLTQYYGPFAVALDRGGDRFTDESESELEHTLAQDTALQADGRAYYVLDADLYDDEVFSMGHVGTIIERSADAGAEVLRADGFDDLREQLYVAGVDGATAIETLEAYNEAVEAGTAHRLDPPRRAHARTVDTPPLYAVAVQPGITFTMGGLAVDHRLRVLRAAESRSALFDYEYDAEPLRERPIPGLYAAGVDVGGVNDRHYMGGLAQALVTGYEAAENAVGGDETANTAVGD
jgi:succinate dehydrogenase/fumarate reductase flavoprotein subunit